MIMYVLRSQTTASKWDFDVTYRARSPTCLPGPSGAPGPTLLSLLLLFFFPLLSQAKLFPSSLSTSHMLFLLRGLSSPRHAASACACQGPAQILQPP